MRKRSEVRAAKAKESSASDRSDESRNEIPPPAESEPAPARSKDQPYEFPNANKARVSKAPKELERVAESVFIRDLFAEWKELERALEIGEKRSEHGHAVAALDKAASRAYKAHRLYLTARNMLEAWELDNEVIFGAMWSEATRSIQAEKEQGIRRKAITNDDIKKRCATMFPDEYRAQEAKRRELAFAVKSLERLAEIWVGKQRDASAMVGKLRG